MDTHRQKQDGLAAQVERLLEVDGSAVRSAREEAGLTQAELADLVGANWVTISRIERGTIKRSKLLPQIFRVLGAFLAEGQRVADRPAAPSRPPNALAKIQDDLAHVISLVQALGMAADSVSDPDVSEPFASMAIVIHRYLDDLAGRLDMLEGGEA